MNDNYDDGPTAPSVSPPAARSQSHTSSSATDARPTLSAKLEKDSDLGLGLDLDLPADSQMDLVCAMAYFPLVPLPPWYAYAR